MTALSGLRAGRRVVFTSNVQMEPSVWLAAAGLAVAVGCFAAGLWWGRRSHARRRTGPQNDTARSQLTTVSHEMRTPLTAILGFTDQLLDPSLTAADKSRAVHTIRSSSVHLLALIGDILDASKIDAGMLRIERVDCDPAAIVAEALHTFSPRAAAKGLTLEAVCDGPIPKTISTDPTRLRQVLFNLLSNALKFTNQGYVRVHMRMEAAQSRFVVEVRDSGVGIPDEQQAALFQPFTQADISTSRQYGGTGLGLSISRSLAELLGGTLTLTSVAGSGTTLTLSIDPGDVNTTPTTSCFTMEHINEAPPSSAHESSLRARILLVDDSPDLRRLITFQLRRHGASVVTASSGEEAINAARGTESDPAPGFDLILMDLHMPGMNGGQAARALRDAGIVAPIIALSAEPQAADNPAWAQAGFSEFASKPIEMEQLLALCERHLRKDTRTNAA